MMNQTDILHSKPEIPRWRMLICSILVALCTGSIYAFSVFVGPLGAARGWSPAEAVMAFTINLAIAPIPMIISGKLVDKGYAKECILAGGAIYGLGFFLSGTATSIPLFYLYYGILCGIGHAVAYSGELGNAIRLFPDRRGLAVGLVAAGDGGGAILIAPALSYLIQTHNVLFALNSIGALFVVVSIVAGSLVNSAPTGYIPKDWTPPQPAQGVGTMDESLPWNKMVQSPRFYMILIMFGIGTLSGLMIVSNLSRIGQSMFGLTATVAALYVSFYSLSNCLGRIVWGSISDKIGRYNALMAIFVVISCMLLLLANTSSAVLFLIAIVGIGLCFGGTMGVMPPIVTENFGTKYYGVNFGIVFVGYALAAYFGPRLAVSVAALNGDNFTQAFYIAFLCGLIGLTVTVLHVVLNRKNRRKAVELV